MRIVSADLDLLVRERIPPVPAKRIAPAHCSVSPPPCGHFQGPLLTDSYCNQSHAPHPSSEGKLRLSGSQVHCAAVSVFTRALLSENLQLASEEKRKLLTSALHLSRLLNLGLPHMTSCLHSTPTEAGVRLPKLMQGPHC